MHHTNLCQVGLSVRIPRTCSLCASHQLVSGRVVSVRIPWTCSFCASHQLVSGWVISFRIPWTCSVCASHQLVSGWVVSVRIPGTTPYLVITYQCTTLTSGLNTSWQNAMDLPLFPGTTLTTIEHCLTEYPGSPSLPWHHIDYYWALPDIIPWISLPSLAPHWLLFSTSWQNPLDLLPFPGTTLTTI